MSELRDVGEGVGSGDLLKAFVNAGFLGLAATPSGGSIKVTSSAASNYALKASLLSSLLNNNN